MEEGSRCTAVSSELTLLEQGSPALEMIAFFVQCLEIFEDDLQSGRQCSVALLVLLWSF